MYEFIFKRTYFTGRQNDCMYASLLKIYVFERTTIHLHLHGHLHRLHLHLHLHPHRYRSSLSLNLRDHPPRCQISSSSSISTWKILSHGSVWLSPLRHFIRNNHSFGVLLFPSLLPLHIDAL